MIEAAGVDRFWDLYRTLDDPSTVFRDLLPILRQLGKGRAAARRRLHLLAEFVRARLSCAKAKEGR